MRDHGADLRFGEESRSGIARLAQVLNYRSWGNTLVLNCQLERLPENLAEAVYRGVLVPLLA